MSHAASIEHKGSSKEIAIQRTLRRERWNSAKRMKLLYLFFLVPFVVFFVFHYMPMYGLLIAFKQYRVIDGIWGSPWNNFRHFEMLFSNIYFGRILRNTTWPCRRSPHHQCVPNCVLGFRHRYCWRC